MEERGDASALARGSRKEGACGGASQPWHLTVLETQPGICYCVEALAESSILNAATCFCFSFLSLTLIYKGCTQ